MSNYYMICRHCNHRQLSDDYALLGACTACGKNPVTPEGRPEGDEPTTEESSLGPVVASLLDDDAVSMIDGISTDTPAVDSPVESLVESPVEFGDGGGFSGGGSSGEF